MNGARRKVVLLAGGVGGARMAEGLSRALPEEALTVIANVGDDDTFYGLLVCPDIDTILYTLSDRIDRRQGWGVADDTVNALNMLRDLGAPVWMKLGDADFGLHIWRSWRLGQGASLQDVIAECAVRLKVPARILPATDDLLRTKLLTDEGLFDFQAWFVGHRCKPRVREVRYVGADIAVAGSAALESIRSADLIVFAPSNPLLSIEPILAVKAIRDAVRQSRVPRIGISPLINGKAVKGPLAQLLADLGQPGGASGVAARYGGLLDGFVVDRGDTADIDAIRSDGLSVLGTDIMMRDPADAERLAREVLDFAAGLRPISDGGPL
ncbi:2-phospho-L-lactate transferase [Pseudochelatococcus sp. B33]